MKKKINLSVTFLAAFFCAVLFFPSAANAQRRDYLTEAEVELVRNNQSIDQRIGVLMRAVERRLAVLKNQPLKEKGDWGAAPAGTPTQLLTDIEKLLQKGIDDIDDVASRNRDNSLFPKAVHKFADACREYQPQFKTFLDTAPDEKTRGVLLGSLEKCESVIEASSKVQRDPKEEKKKKN